MSQRISTAIEELLGEYIGDKNFALTNLAETLCQFKQMLTQ